MRIEKFSFGTVVINGNEYKQDVFVTNDSVEEKENSHKITKDDLDKILLYEPDIVVIGRGTSNNVEIPDEIKVMLAQNNIKLIDGKTPDVIEKFNKLVSKNKIVGILHLTC